MKILKHILLSGLLVLTGIDFASGLINFDDGSASQNYILIQGSSNVNQFEFVNHSININKTDSMEEKFQRKIKIPVEEFTGPDKRMTRDFYEMVDAVNYPYINILIESKNRADFDEETGLTKFKTKISIAGTTRKFIVPCEIISFKGSGYLLKGHLQVNLTDFNISPPKKVFGMVKVNNQVFINFAFAFDSKEVLTENLQF